MNTYYLTKLKKMWNSGVPELDRYNRKAWIKSIRVLGDKWLLKKAIDRLQT
jgi:hypothetical protein|tara:strand:+ start:1075 stop:1227 length:153 start_codon:yes stop_codon:yes gene_type:complete